MVELIELRLEPRGFGPVSLAFEAGETVLLCGRSGSGKSTLCQLICGRQEASDGTVHGLEETRVGFLAHDFENQLLGTTVEEELQLGRALPLGCSRLDDALRGLTAPFLEKGKTSPHSLSKAEQQVLLLYCLVRSGARLLVLDESLSHLDPVQRELFLGVVGELKRVGVSSILVSHQSEVLEVVDRVVALADGAVVYDGATAGFAGSLFERVGFIAENVARPENLERDGSRTGAGSLIVEGPMGKRIELRDGELLAIGGLAGSGKTSVLESLFGLPSEVGWTLSPSCAEKCFLRQTVGPSFWRGSVRREWEVSRGSFAGLEPSLEAFYRDLIPESWWERSPQQLSHGQLRFFGAICLLAQNPRVIFLDQPFLGLDGMLRAGLSEALESYLAAGGRAVMASNSFQVLERWAGTVLWLERGECRWSGAPKGPDWKSLVSR